MPKAVRRAESPAKAKEPSTLAHHVSREDALGDVLSIDSEDIRGVPLTLLLGGFGRLFARGGAIAREQPELVYSYSRQVETIDYFISHSWSAGRLQKIAALLMFFNASPAFFCSIVIGTALVLFEIHCFDQLPGWLIAEQADNLNDMQQIRMSNLFLLLISPVLLVALLLWHRLSDTGGRSLFLDIACICQNDVVRKARGIESLGALLDRSETMLVLLDETYFTRLWCTFEVACFAKRAGAHRLKIIPVQQTLVEFAATIMWILVHFVIALSFIFSSSVRNQEETRTIIAVIFLAIIAPLQTIVLQAMLAGQRSAAALGKLKTFRLDQCECYSDRDALLRLIAKWYEDPASAHLPEETQRAIGWHRFENYVRHDLRLQLLASAGPGDRLSAEAIRRLGLYTSLSYIGMLGSPHVGLAKMLTLACCVMLNHCLATPLMYRLVAWCASLISRLRRAGWPGPVAFVFGLVVAGVLVLAMSISVNNLGTVGSMWSREGYVSADDGLSAEQRRVAKQQIVLIAVMVVGLRMRN